jgi:hypothetical protein
VLRADARHNATLESERAQLAYERAFATVGHLVRADARSRQGVRVHYRDRGLILCVRHSWRRCCRCSAATCAVDVRTGAVDGSLADSASR